MNNYFYKKNPWWSNQKFNFGILRSKYLDQLSKNLSQKLIQIVTGLRRVGKSTILLQLISYLIQERHINPLKILFFSIEEPSLKDLSVGEIINQFRAEHNLKVNQKIYVFIDEVQCRDNWELEIKSLYDTENIKFILSGSSALLLSEKSSLLTGRYQKNKINPLDFKEYLSFKDKKYDLTNEQLLVKQSENYLLSGGMPEFILYEPDRYLSTTIESILFKDLVSKFQLRNPKILEDLIFLLADRVGSISSSLKLSQILQINKDTVLSYINYLDKVFLVSCLSTYSSSRNKRIYNPEKIYFADTGVMNNYSSKANFGALAENAIFSYLLEKIGHKRLNLGYWFDNKLELDFILSKGRKKSVIESKWIDKITQINFKPLKAFLSKHEPKKIIYITRSLDTKELIFGKKVCFIPLYKFLFQQTLP